MNQKDFDNLVASIREAGRIRRGEVEERRITERVAGEQSPMSLADEIQASFPPGVELPDVLRQLCKYLERKGPPLSGFFQLRPGEDYILRRYFGDDAAAIRFAGFGAAGDGSVYAYWLGDARDATEAPVVFLDHDGDKCLVLAASTEEFLSLLAIGYDDLGYDFQRQPPPLGREVRWFRKWLHDRLGIEPAPSAQAVIERANAAHPEFHQWLRTWRRENGWPEEAL